MGEENDYKEETLQVWETGKAQQKECTHCSMIAHHPVGSATFSHRCRCSCGEDSDKIIKHIDVI